MYRRLMMTAAAMAFSTILMGQAGAADPPAVTFHKDIQPILQASCQACHRPGGDNFTGLVAPMPLVNYEDVRPWAKSIATEVSAKRMPPWFAASEFHGVFSNERTLTAGEIETIVAWVNTGARRGNPAEAPEPRVFPDWNGWRIGVPDLIVETERFFVEDEVEDRYVNLRVQLTPEMLPEDVWVEAIEWRGGSDVVHHIVGSHTWRDESGATQREGLGSIAPGEEALTMPAGFAKMLHTNSTILFNMHYHKEAGPETGSWDVSQVAFKFAPKPPKFIVHQNAIGNSGFEIPPGHPDWKVSTARILASDTVLLKMHPHMHLRGKDAKYVAYYPDGRVETLLYVPQWNFNWQTDYSLREPVLLPAGTRIEYTATFDNSTANIWNPDPGVSIRFGQKTTDEMMLGYVTYAEVESLDDYRAAMKDGKK